MTDSEDVRGADAEYVFDCSACDESMQVNASMRDALVTHGCVVCGGAVSRDSFSAW